MKWNVCVSVLLNYMNMIVFKGELLIFHQNLNNPNENDIKVKLAFLMALSIYHKKQYKTLLALVNTVQINFPILEAIQGLGILGNKGTMTFISGEQGNKGLNEGNSGTKAILGNRKHRKSKF